MNHQTIIRQLRDALANLYTDTASARRIARDAGLRISQIAFDGPAINIWQAILTEAIHANRIHILLFDVAQYEYPNNTALDQACAAYRAFIEQGGRFDMDEGGDESRGRGGAIGIGNIGVGNIGVGNIGVGNISDSQHVVVGNNVYVGTEPPPTPASHAPDNDAANDSAQAQLAAMPTDTIPPIAPLPVGSRLLLPYNDYFVGREAELQALAQRFKGKTTTRGNIALIGQVAAATGMGGIGKTQLATTFGYHYGQFFTGGVYWINMADAASVPSEVVQCGLSMMDVGVELGAEYAALDLATQVQRVLGLWRRETPRLLIFDNCEDPALLDQWRPPSGGCRVLVTSRRQQWSRARAMMNLPLATLTRAQSIDLLLKFRPDLREPTRSRTFAKSSTSQPLDAIAEELGDLPLALHLAGSYLDTYRYDITPTDYLQALRQQTPLAHESLQAAASHDVDDYSPTKHDLHVKPAIPATRGRREKLSRIEQGF